MDCCSVVGPQVGGRKGEMTQVNPVRWPLQPGNQRLFAPVWQNIQDKAPAQVSQDEDVGAVPFFWAIS